MQVWSQVSSRPATIGRLIDKSTERKLTSNYFDHLRITSSWSPCLKSRSFCGLILNHTSIRSCHNKSQVSWNKSKWNIESCQDKSKSRLSKQLPSRVSSQALLQLRQDKGKYQVCQTGLKTSRDVSVSSLMPHRNKSQAKASLQSSSTTLRVRVKSQVFMSKMRVSCKSFMSLNCFEPSWDRVLSQHEFKLSTRSERGYTRSRRCLISLSSLKSGQIKSLQSQVSEECQVLGLRLKSDLNPSLKPLQPCLFIFRLRGLVVGLDFRFLAQSCNYSRGSGLTVD